MREKIKEMLIARAIGLLGRNGYLVRKPFSSPQVPDAPYYTPGCGETPVFSPWLHGGYKGFRPYMEAASNFTIVSSDRCYVLFTLGAQAARQLNGQFFECGVYRGGTAVLLSKLLFEKRNDPTVKLHLFDTFEGMPGVDGAVDLHKKGDFADTALEDVKARIPHKEVVEFHKGYIPDTFVGLESAEVAFAHIDVDIHRSVLDCCEFIYPRLQRGGFMVFDDYGFPSCPGARKAVDEFFLDKGESPLVLPTGQAVIFKGL